MSTAELHRIGAGVDAETAGHNANGASGVAGSVHRIGSDEEALARTEAVLDQIAAGASERDRERRLPVAAVELLSAEGLLAITVPAEFGGAGVSAETLARVLSLLAGADPNVAQIPQSHFVYLELVRQLGTGAQQELLFGEALAGRRLANAQSEAGSKTVADIRTSLRPAADGPAANGAAANGASANGPAANGAATNGAATNEAAADAGFILDGEKFYCTGSLLAHWLTVLAKDQDARTQVAIVSPEAEGVSIVDDWKGMGQRTTASGTVKLDRVRVPTEMVIPHHRMFERPQVYGARAQLLHTAIDVGIASGALQDAVEFVHSSSRPWFDAGVERASEDPLLIQRVGELAIGVRAAQALLAEAGRTIDAVQAQGVDEAGSARASIAVATAKAFADRVAVETASALFELAGTRSAVNDLNLHRHWRNARTHTLHDPVRWKLQHIGRYTLNGTLPPQHGQL
jgi:alkylation response protein AidB-like acyl-CoA dehydrogenase